MIDMTRAAYRIRPPQIWGQIRDEWERGAGTRDLSRRHGVPHNTISCRKTREGWARREDPRALTDTGDLPLTALRVAEAALRHAVSALAAGRANDAAAFIKAGDAVGMFAEFVGNLRSKEAQG